MGFDTIEIYLVSTKLAIFDYFFLKQDFYSSLPAFLEGKNVPTHTFSGFSLLRPSALTDQHKNVNGNKYTSCELKFKFS